MDTSDWQKTIIGAVLAVVAGVGAWLKHLLWSKIERTIDDRIRKHLSPVVRQLQEVASDCHDSKTALATMNTTFERLEGALGENIGKLAIAIEKLSDKVALQGEEISKFEGRWEGKERRTGSERRRRGAT